MRIVTTVFFFFSSRRRHTRYWRDWSSDVCSSDLSREEVQRALSGPTFRVYTNDDVAGTELGGAVKNVLAIAAGMVSGQIGRASCRGRVEISVVAVSLKKKKKLLHVL